MARGKTPRQFVTISDPLFGKYEIQKDETQYVLVLKDNPMKQLSYHTQLSSVLRKITELRMSEKATLSLGEYVAEYKAALQGLKDAIPC